MLAAFSLRLRDLSIEAIKLAVDRFHDNAVPAQSATFAPSLPEFIAEVRKCEGLLQARDAPKRPALPPYRPGKLSPFEIARNKLSNENADRHVLHENVSLEQFKKLSASKEIPAGSKWVAALGTIYGPPAFS